MFFLLVREDKLRPFCLGLDSDMTQGLKCQENAREIEQEAIRNASRALVKKNEVRHRWSRDFQFKQTWKENREVESAAAGS